MISTEHQSLHSLQMFSVFTPAFSTAFSHVGNLWTACASFSLSMMSCWFASTSPSLYVSLCYAWEWLSGPAEEPATLPLFMWIKFMWIKLYLARKQRETFNKCVKFCVTMLSCKKTLAMYCICWKVDSGG